MVRNPAVVRSEKKKTEPCWALLWCPQQTDVIHILPGIFYFILMKNAFYEISAVRFMSKCNKILTF